jgi:hypothetical protein
MALNATHMIGDHHCEAFGQICLRYETGIFVQLETDGEDGPL